MKKTDLDKVVGAVLKLGQSEDLQKMVFGTYSDGTPKSLIDSINGEVLSPKQKRKKLYKKKKVKKHKIKL